MKSGTIFNRKEPEQKIDFDKNIDCSSLANSLYSIDFNNPVKIRENSKENDNFAKDINQMQNMLNKTFEDNTKEKEIEKMKKKIEEMDAIIKKQNEEFKKKEEENSKYKSIIAEKENEIKKKLEEKEKKIK